MSVEATGEIKAGEEETDSSIPFQLGVRLSNDLLVNPKYAMVLHGLDLNFVYPENILKHPNIFSYFVLQKSSSSSIL